LSYPGKWHRAGAKLLFPACRQAGTVERTAKINEIIFYY